MSADLLRRAASLMRERATAATPSADPMPGGWAGYSRADLGSAEIFGGPSVNGYRDSSVLSFTEYVDCDNCGRPSAADVEHIASWHPAVALAVADWLEEGAAQIDSAFAPESFLANTPHLRRASAVARAYLGES